MTFTSKYFDNTLATPFVKITPARSVSLPFDPRKMENVLVFLHKGWRDSRYSLLGHSYHVDQQLVLKVGHVRLLCRLLRLSQAGL